MITELRGYAKAIRPKLTRLSAVVLVLALLFAGTAFAAAPDAYAVDIYDGPQITRVETSKTDP